MRNRLWGLLVSALTFLGGSAAGYFLWVPLIDIPVETGFPIVKPLFENIGPYFHAHGAGYLTTALVLFLLHLPNTLVVSFVAAFTLKSISRRRLAFYSVFLWPLFMYLVYWIEVWRLKLGARRLGVPSDMEHLPTDVYINYKTVLILLTYSLFAVIVIATYKFARPSPHNPSLSRTRDKAPRAG